MKIAEQYISSRIDQRKENNSLRSLQTNSSLIDFSSNDYLGFSILPQLKNNILKAAASTEIVTGSTGSRLISGNDEFIERLESKISNYHFSEAGLIFNSGYDANLGLFSSLPQRDDTIIMDELVHASIIDGARLSFANRFSFRHNDLSSLEEKLKTAKGRIYIAVESVYSMDGDESPLEGIAQLAEKYDAALIVDEAHATGIFGAKGEGLVCEKNLQDKVFARIITFGKALGCHGAIVLGSEKLRTYLINFARSFIYTTAAPPLVHICIDQAYEQLLSRNYPQLINEKISFFRNEAGGLYSKFIESWSAIQCIIVPGNASAKRIEKNLQEAGFNVRAILHPTVAEGSERLRFCLHTYNTYEEITSLLTTLKQSL